MDSDAEELSESAPSSGVIDEIVVRLNPGEVVPGTRYRILRWLGEGGMGVVYECIHVDLERHVALKILRPGISPDSRKARMFREEARAVSRAAAKEGRRAQNIVEVFDFGELPDGRMWFAMELLDGKSLAACLGEGPMDQGRLIGILRQVCKGLAAAHDADVIHRDVKPGNVMLVNEGRRKDFVKIVDFGVAAMLSSPSDDQIQLEGTPIYMAPEQASWGKFDRRLDVYAVGAMAFHLLVGRPPFIGTTVFKILRRIRKDPAPKPSQVSPPEIQIHPALEAVILKCLEKKPEDRFDDMRELEAALCDVQLAAKIRTDWDDLPIPDVDPTRREMLTRAFAARKQPFAWRAWLVAAAAVIVSLGLLSWIVFGRASSSATPNEVLAHVEGARAAAAKAFFVYPPTEDPHHPTAYTEVLTLEGMTDQYGDDAADAAELLRAEFAGTLVRLGDRYWDKPGGRPFATDYYIEALLFDPDNEHASARAPVTAGALAALEGKAAKLDFSELELRASEPLIALAEPDEETRVRKLVALEKDGDERGVHAKTALRELILEEKKASPRAKAIVEAAEEREPKTDEAEPAEPEVPVEPVTTQQEELQSGDTLVEVDDIPANPPANEADDDEPERAAARARPARDTEAATRYVAQGIAAHKAGSRSKAESAFQKALSLDSRSHEAYDGLARVAFDWGDYNRAVRYGRRAVALSPSRGSYRIHLGDAYYKIFRYREARAEYERARELGHAGAGPRLKKVEKKIAQ